MKNIPISILKNLIILIFISQFSLCFPAVSAENVEEGWRLHNKLRVELKYENINACFDFADEHYAMAHVLRPHPVTRPIETESTARKGKKEVKTEGSDKYLCLIRFTPILLTEDIAGIIRVEPPIYLTQEIFEENAGCEQIRRCGTYNEIGFLSGHYTPNPTKKNHKSQEVLKHISIIPEERQENAISDAFSVKLAQRLYINPSQLEKNLNFRYPTTDEPICFKGGNYAKLLEANAITYKNILYLKQARETILENIRNCLERGDSQGASTLIDRLDPKLDPKVNDRNEDEKLFKEFSCNPHMNSYTCAEQTALDFLENSKVQEYLKGKIKLISDTLRAIVAAVVVNINCSHTPCCSCASAFAAEILEGGIFKRIFEGKNIILLCSANQWYHRPQKMIPYSKTNFLFTPSSLEGINPSLDQEEKEKIFVENVANFQECILSFDLKNKIFMAYPIVMLTYDAMGKLYSIDYNETTIGNFATEILEEK